MLAAIALLAAVHQDSAKEALEKTIKHYQSLSSYSAEIECHDASGLFPGSYKHRLQWLAPKRFELTLSKKSDYVRKDNAPGNPAWEFWCNGREVLTRREDGSTSTREVEVDPNTSPAWEVSAGLVLSALLKTPQSQFLLAPPEGFKVEWSWAARKEWEGLKVRELKGAITYGSQGSMDVYLLLGADSDTFVGEEYHDGGKRHWRIYRGAVENPKLPKTLGDHPK